MHCILHSRGRVSINSQMGNFKPVKYFQMSKFIDLIAVSNEVCTNILGQDTSILPFYDSNKNM